MHVMGLPHGELRRTGRKDNGAGLRVRPRSLRVGHRAFRAATSADIILVTSQALATNFGTLLFESPHATPC